VHPHLEPIPGVSTWLPRRVKFVFSVCNRNFT
jgi:hypothetical protein